MHLMVCGNRICKEYVFAEELADRRPVLIRKQIFGLRRDVTLSFERNGELLSVLCNYGDRLTDGTGEKSSALLGPDTALSLRTAAGEKLRLFFSSQTADLQVSDKYILYTGRQIRIGSAGENEIVYSFASLVGGEHALLFFYNNGWYVRALEPGVCVNDAAVNDIKQLHFGDTVYIYGLRIVYFGKILCVGNAFGVCNIGAAVKPYDVARNMFGVRGEGREMPAFNRPARKLPSIESGEIEIDSPPAVPEEKKKSLLSTIGRSLTMAIPMVLGCTMMAVGMAGNGTFMSLGIITAVSSAVLGAVWALHSLSERNEEEFDKDRLRFNAYGNYLISVAQELAVRYRSNYLALSSMYPSADRCVLFDESSPMLWSRNATHGDFLFVRLGSGSMPFDVSVKTPKAGFVMRQDALTNGPQQIAAEYAEMKNIPVGVDLQKQQLIGLISSSGRLGSIRAVQLMIAQLAANVCYTDLKIVLLNTCDSDEDRRIWDCLRYLPHSWSSDQQTRYYSMNRSSVEDISYELLKIMRVRDSAEKKENPLPYYLIIVTDPMILDRNMLSNYILKPQPEYGVTTLILAGSRTQLPNTCRFVIECDAGRFYMSDLLDPRRQRTEIVADRIRTEQLTGMAHRLAGIKVEDKLREQVLPASLDFLSMYGVRSVDELHIAAKWRTGNICENINVPIGMKADGGLCCLDIHEKFHGPHGLVAGTTGSGKSELLQSYILSLCVNFSPEDINFLIIDYKGGGMANLFSGLPHLAGQITNLSGNGIRRAMISIKSESLRRQKLFSEYYVNSINQYTQLYKDGRIPVPIPHLLIIVDEFAELKKSESDFMHELISIAQVGRSLGIHLILATQKPNGTIDDNIRSNSKFRICLRVQDKQDSMDMLHHPDAAYITQPGGAIFQVGSDEIFEPFQSAWSGAPYDADADPADKYAVLLNETGKPVNTAGGANVKRSEKRKLAWYGAVVNVIRRIKPADTPIRELHGEQALQLCARTAVVLNGTQDYHGNAENLLGFLELWPENDAQMTDQEIARHMVVQAERTGVKMPEFDIQTQLEALSHAVSETAEKNNCPAARQLWLPLLPERITVGELDRRGDLRHAALLDDRVSPSLRAPVGLMDDPVNQMQSPVFVDFFNGGHHAVIGSVATGKSTLMQTVLYGLCTGYSPDDLNIYIVDYSSRLLGVFCALPHVGGVVFEEEQEKLDKLFLLMRDILAERKKRLAGESFLDNKRRKNDRLPAILLLIDNYAGVKEKTEGKYESLLVQLSREGLAYGVFLFVSGAGFGMADISSRVGENIKTVLALELTDKYKYFDALHTTSVDILPESGIKGRGLIKTNDRCLEYQTALMNDMPDDYSRGKEAEKEFAAIADAWTGAAAVPIPEIPVNPGFSEFAALPDVQEAFRDAVGLPLGYSETTARAFLLPLDGAYCMTVVGQAEHARRNVLNVLTQSALSCPSADVVRICADGAETEPRNGETRLKTVRGEEELLEFFRDLTPEFVKRNKYKKELLQNGVQEDELFEKMRRFRPLFVFVDDLDAFFSAAYGNGGKEKKMNGFLENILSKGVYHNVYFFGGLNAEDAARLNIYPAFKSFTAEKRGILADLAPAAQKTLDFGGVPFSESGKAPRRGTVYVTGTENGANTLERVVLPNLKR